MPEKTNKLSDPSGRGRVDGYRVIFPMMQHPYTEAEIQAVTDVMRHAEGQTQGARLEKFEADFAAFVGAKHAFAVNNCTNALKLAAIFCRIRPGDEIIAPGYTYMASVVPFGDLGAKIVWADIHPKTWTIDPDDIERKITPNTKAILAVHLLGLPCDMRRIMAIAEKRGIKVVEDCAQAMDCRVDGRHVGTFGDFGCFSFHAAKTMTTLGEGGMIVVRDDETAKLAPGIRHNGLCAFEGERERYWVPAMSNVESFMDGQWPQNFCIGEAQCALGSEQLKSVVANNEILIDQDRRIRAALADVGELAFPEVVPGGRYVVHQYVLHYDGSAIGKRRNDLLDLVTRKYGVRCITQYYPLYRYPLFQKMGMGGHDCPVLDKWWDDSFSLPWWCGIDGESMSIMTGGLRSAAAELRAGAADGAGAASGAGA
ncbi:MAG: DegT/DnrJ/EryC1/StrS family aminotransferase [Clostridiales bacterium]|jgi:dTDP-4-amino-4,6-dideoxygalactose transaminase|nr:DegT/DnrJ/EryC1/StrS family aminotransferase [Clostridiales bacterium]